MKPTHFLPALLLLTASPLTSPVAFAADAQSKVLEDIQRFAEPSRWIYNDLDRGLAEAKKTNKPLLVIFRCVPCVACSAFDKRVLEKENEIVDLLDLFVCVRIIHGNGMDLSLFQFDYDQSFHVFFLNPDKTIYGQFGTRSFRKEEEDMTMEGMRKAMLGALDLHSRFSEVKASLAAKRGPAQTVARPENYPNLQGKFDAKLSTEGNVARSCIHCHQIRESDRLTYRNSGQPMPDDVLYPYPLPDVLGMRFDPKERATLTAVEEGSIAGRAGLQPGDWLISLNGQPLLSIADVQWVLHTTGSSATLKAEVERDGKRQPKSLILPAGWRRSDIS
ncbi:MAG: thioredoxin family protein, partial [Opitutaceae bacterium]|nr:thioredoxin family protein [Verrucomicrobiales bacterium]